MIQPHRGTLVNKELPKFEKERILGQIKEFEKIQVRPETLKVIKNISFGIFSPLEGFMNENDYHYVLKTMYLERDIPWPFPITLDVSEEELNENVPLLFLGIGAAICILVAAITTTQVIKRRRSKKAGLSKVKKDDNVLQKKGIAKKDKILDGTEFPKLEGMGVPKPKSDKALEFKIDEFPKPIGA